MAWNYRVLKRTLPSGEEEFGIVEAYYNEDQFIEMYTDFVDVNAETLENVEWMLNKMEEALKKEVIDDFTFVPNTIK